MYIYIKLTKITQLTQFIKERLELCAQMKKLLFCRMTYSELFFQCYLFVLIDVID